MADLVALYEEQKKRWGHDASLAAQWAFIDLEASIRLPWNGHVSYQIESFGNEGLTNEWRKLDGFSASFSLSIFATVNEPEALRGCRIGASFNDAGFRSDDLENGFLGRGTLVENYLQIGITVPPHVVKDIWERLRFPSPPISNENEQIIRFALVNVRPGESPAQARYDVVRIYL